MRITGTFLLSVLLLSAVAGSNHGYAEVVRATILFPGSGFESVRIGQPMSSSVGHDVTIKGPTLRGVLTVRRIEVHSPRFVLAGSQLRVKWSNLQDIRRYYGEGQTTYGGDNVVVRFPSAGVEFTVGRMDEKIQSIAVFQPERFPAEKYRRDQNKIKQFKDFKY